MGQIYNLILKGKSSRQLILRGQKIFLLDLKGLSRTERTVDSQAHRKCYLDFKGHMLARNRQLILRRAHEFSDWYVGLFQSTFSASVK